MAGSGTFRTKSNALMLFPLATKRLLNRKQGAATGALFSLLTTHSLLRQNAVTRDDAQTTRGGLGLSELGARGLAESRPDQKARGLALADYLQTKVYQVHGTSCRGSAQ